MWITKKEGTDRENAKLFIDKTDSPFFLARKSEETLQKICMHTLLYLLTSNWIETFSPVGCPLFKTCISLLHQNKGYDKISTG